MKDSSVILPKKAKHPLGKPTESETTEPRLHRVYAADFAEMLKAYLEENYRGVYVLEHEDVPQGFLMINPSYCANLLHGVLACVFGRDLAYISLRSSPDFFSVEISFKKWSPTVTDLASFSDLALHSGFSVRCLEHAVILSTGCGTFSRDVYQSEDICERLANAFKMAVAQMPLPILSEDN